MDRALIVSTRTLRIRTILTAAALTLSIVAARAQSITEFDVPSGGYPAYVAPGPGGMWFTLRDASRLGRIDASGHVTEFPIPRPANRIVAGPDGLQRVRSGEIHHLRHQ